jgi:E3 ubiquitin-protein ligase XBAT32/33
MSVAHDGNAVEAWILLELDPSLTLRYYTFDGLNAPLHFAAARGHVDVRAISSRCLFVI